MLIAFLAPRVQLAKLCKAVLAQLVSASPALLVCDIRLLLRSQRTSGLKSCSASQAKFASVMVETLGSEGGATRLLNRLQAEATHQKKSA